MYGNRPVFQSVRVRNSIRLKIRFSLRVPRPIVALCAHDGAQPPLLYTCHNRVDRQSRSLLPSSCFFTQGHLEPSEHDVGSLILRPHMRDNKVPRGPQPMIM